MAESCGCTCVPKDLAHTTGAYRRALWIVALLNLGMGFAEGVGGFLARSQALKADALDFFGDGTITLLGVAALRWRPAWRSRSALLQGVFLGVMGAAVFAATLYRFFQQTIPEAEAMGALGVAGLAVNVAAALILLPHRSGDANVRAVWLFSRNDALANVAVIAAAVAVAWSHTAWPDLVVAAAVSGLFLHSARAILRDAVTELR